MFEDVFKRVVLPRATEYGFHNSTDAKRGCSVSGTFEQHRHAIAYCMGYQWMHFASFKRVPEVLNVRPHELLERLLVVDVGCGPGTALAAFGEWLRPCRRRHLDIRYIGIDRSRHMRDLAAEFAADDTLFEPHQPVFFDDIAAMTAQSAAQQAAGRDQIVVLLSYVIHQEFLIDGALLRDFLAKLYQTRLPIYILAQDANKAIVLDKAHLWPDKQLKAILEDAGRFGYGHRVWHDRFSAPHYEVMSDGTAQPEDGHGNSKTIAMAARVEVDRRTHVL